MKTPALVRRRSRRVPRSGASEAQHPGQLPHATASLNRRPVELASALARSRPEQSGVCVFRGKGGFLFPKPLGSPVIAEREARGTEGSGPSCRRSRRRLGGRDRDVRPRRRRLRDRPHVRQRGQTAQPARSLRRRGPQAGGRPPRRRAGRRGPPAAAGSARTPRRSAPGRRTTATRSTTAAASPATCVRRTRRRTADRPAARPGGAGRPGLARPARYRGQIRPVAIGHRPAARPAPGRVSRGLAGPPVPGPRRSAIPSPRGRVSHRSI